MLLSLLFYSRIAKKFINTIVNWDMRKFWSSVFEAFFNWPLLFPLVKRMAWLKRHRLRTRQFLETFSRNNCCCSSDAFPEGCWSLLKFMGLESVVLSSRFLCSADDERRWLYIGSLTKGYEITRYTHVCCLNCIYLIIIRYKQNLEWRFLCMMTRLSQNGSESFMKIIVW